MMSGVAVAVLCVVLPSAPGDLSYRGLHAVSSNGTDVCAIAAASRRTVRSCAGAKAYPSPGRCDATSAQVPHQSFLEISAGDERAWGLTTEGSVVCLGDDAACGPWYYRGRQGPMLAWEVATVRNAITASCFHSVACSYAYHDPGGAHSRYHVEDCHWDAAERFDAARPDFVLDITVASASSRVDGSATPSRSHSISAALRDFDSLAVIWTSREVVALDCVPQVAASPALPLRLGLGLRAGAEVGSTLKRDNKRENFGVSLSARPVYFPLGCAGHELLSCRYVFLGVSASPWSRWLSADVGLADLGLLSGVLTGGPLWQREGDGRTRYGVNAALFVGVLPSLSAGFGIRAWAVHGTEVAWGVRLTQDVALHLYEGLVC